MTPLCTVEGCDRQRGVGRKGWCLPHYYKWRRHGDPAVSVVRRHHPATCEVAGCDRPYSARGYCRIHYRRWKKHGDPLVVLPSRTGGYLTDEGYRSIYRPEHPNAQRSGLIPEHRFVMSETLGRPLYPGETVHHRNGNRTDNRPENLELRAGSHGVGADTTALVAWAIEVLRRYEPASLAVGISAHSSSG